ncbi:MAG TPA: ATP-binding protein [Aliidongia sp.]|nr:ATP-binding protein [Aliidongia sp.]
MPFGGRAAEIASLNAWLNDPAAPRNMLLSAPAGRGKTALLVRWVEQLPPDLRRAFIPISIRAETNQARVFYEALANRLAILLGESTPATPVDPVTFFKERVKEYLARFENPAQPCLVVIDGLDEATGWRVTEALLPIEPPAGLRVVVSARWLAGDDHDQDWLRRLGWSVGERTAISHEVRPLDRDGIADVLARMGYPLAHLADDVDLVGELHRLTDHGDPLLVKLYVDDLLDQPDAAARLQPSDLQKLKPGFPAFFKTWFDHQKDAWNQAGRALDEDRINLILAILGCALGPLMLSDIGAVIDAVAPGGALVTLDTLAPIERFVIGDGVSSGFVLAHPKLGDYLRHTRFASSDMVARVDAGFLAWGQRVLRDVNSQTGAPERVPRYLLIYYLQHLQHAEHAPLERYRELAENGWRLAWQREEGGDRSFSEQLEICWQRLLEAARADPAALQRPYIGLGGLIHIGLCLSSIRSVATAVPPNFVAEMVRRGFLAPRQALFLSRFRLDSERAWVMEALAPVLDGTMLDEMHAEARGIRDKPARTRALLAVAQRLAPEDRGTALEEAIIVACGDTNNEHARLGVLSRAVELARQLPPAEAEKIFTLAARFVPREQLPPRELPAPPEYETPLEAEPSIEAPAPSLPAPADADPGTEDGGFSLAEFVGAFSWWEFHDRPEQREVADRLARTTASAVSEDDMRAALDLVLALHQYQRPRLLAALAPHLSADLLAHAVDGLFDDDSPYWLGESLPALAACLDPPASVALVRRLLDRTPFDYSIASIIARLIPILADAAWQDVWPLVAALPISYEKIEILVAAAPRLSAEQTAELVDGVLKPTPTEWSNNYLRGETITRLRALLPPEQLRRILEAAFRTESYDDRRLLECIAPALPRDLLEEALTRALATESSWEQRSRLAPLLSPLAETAPELLERIIEASREIPDTYNRLSLVDLMLPHLTEERRREAIEEVHRIALEIGDRPTVALALAALGEVPDLEQTAPTGPWSVLLEERKAAEEDILSMALIALLPQLDAECARSLLAQTRRRSERLDEDARRIITLITALCPKLDRLAGETFVTEALRELEAQPDDKNAEGYAAFGLMLLFSPYLRADAAERLVARAARLMRDEAAEANGRAALAGLLAIAPRVGFDIAAEAIAFVRAAIGAEDTAPAVRANLIAALGMSSKFTKAEIQALDQGRTELAVNENQMQEGDLVDLVRFGILPYLDGQPLLARGLELLSRLSQLRRVPALVLLALAEGRWGDTLGLRPAISGGMPARSMLERLGGPHAVAETVAAIKAVARWWP